MRDEALLKDGMIASVVGLSEAIEGYPSYVGVDVRGPCLTTPSELPAEARRR